MLAIAVATLIAASSAPTSAPASTYVASGWHVECSAAKRGALQCQAEQQIADRANGHTLVALTVRQPKASAAVILLRLPLGIRVDAGASMTVGLDKPLRFTIDTCTQAGCYVGGTLDASAVAAMRAGSAIRIAFESLSKRTITVSMPTIGFDAAYRKL